MKKKILQQCNEMFVQQPLMYADDVVVFSRLLVQDPAEHCAFLGVVSSGLFVFLAVFGLVCTDVLSQRWRLLLGLIVWATHLTMGFTFIFSGRIVVPWDQVTDCSASSVSSLPNLSLCVSCFLT